MSSGTDLDREEREALRSQRLLACLRELKPAAEHWLRCLEARDEPPTASEWRFARKLREVLQML